MFAALAEALHFGRAARKLGVTQPALSRAIQRLEGELEVVLFERDSRNVRLTEPGVALLARARGIIEQGADAVRATKTAGGSYYGRLVVGTGLCGQHSRIGQLVRHFLELHPGIAVSFVAVEETEIPQTIAGGAVHALIAVEWAFPAGCHVRPLFDTELVAVLPDDHPLAEKEVISPRDLDGLRLVMPNRGRHPMIAEHFGEYCDREGIAPVVDIDAQTLDQLLGLIAGGAAAGLIPFTVPIKYPGLVMKPFRPQYVLRYCLGWRKDSPLTNKVLEALDHLDAEARSQGEVDL